MAVPNTLSSYTLLTAMYARSAHGSYNRYTLRVGRICYQRSGMEWGGSEFSG